MKSCTSVVDWLELDSTAHCTRPEGHGGTHADGCWQWDIYGFRVPRDDDRRDQAVRTAAEIVEASR